MDNLKQALYALCWQYVESRIATAAEAIRSAQQAAGEETKSSAGDKYETGREMMQQETNRNMTQLAEANKLKIALNQIPVDAPPAGIVQPGSLVITDSGNFYIAISAGTLTCHGETCFAVSITSPIGMQLKGKKASEHFSLNNKQYRILSIL
ncbi:3-oxoacyl-ACP synthase [Mucilaginibacter sp. PPCGB 2223]|uniref:3-oxoacyl-ACP synthase n=1 Tax=Mucilaginibacter sp. PPCGB 2223 TaxID=1886027 RepID=UPI0008245F51|nr:3-oxoacyl-ACP synthase [Mucilaginibacter sp. PPCGB 2223]OCX52482.1 3-oxoacyl-ACP synthase [Mucilaginibacter sp. PPCGB 2223]